MFIPTIAFYTIVGIIQVKSLNIRELFAGLYKHCDCKCGALIRIVDKRKRFNRFKRGHNYRGIDHQTWNGGRFKDQQKYWRIYIPEYFSAYSDGYVKEHVYNYQEFNRCCMLPWGVVHHIDTDTNNNMPWNLEGMTNTQHYKIPRKKYNERRKQEISERFCSECGSEETYIGSNGSANWFDDHEGGWLCKKCFSGYQRLIARISSS